MAAAAALAFAPSLTRAQIASGDADLRKIRTQWPTPSLAMAVQKRGQPAIFAVDGERAVNSGAAATTGDLWRISSLTKSMTACLAARLVEAGTIGWDDTIAHHLPDLVGDMQAQYREATLRNLLNHRSGLPNNVGVFDYIRYKLVSPDPRAERLDYVRRALSMTPKGPVGTTFEYSNNGYIVAGAMMEAATSKPWEALMSEQVFQPLGITQAGFGPPGTPRKLDQPLGHMKDLLGDGVHPMQPDDNASDIPAVMGPCGGVHITLADMVRYLSAHRDLSPDYLNAASWQTLHAIAPGNPAPEGGYAMGWFVNKPYALLSHGGWNRRWVALAKVDIANGICVFAVTNNGYQAMANPAVEHAVTLGFSRVAAGTS
jgi:CubicO group peptidase (beta-lactamase class C family)